MAAAVRLGPCAKPELLAGIGSADICNHSVYSLAKSAIRFLTQSLALELGPAITVNAISPQNILAMAEAVISTA